MNANISFAIIAFSFLQVANQDQQAIFLTILWSIGKCRNNKIWNQIEDSSDTICNRVTHLITRGRNVQHLRSSNSNQSQSSSNIKWSKLSPGHLKCNIDASFANNKVGICACI